MLVKDYAVEKGGIKVRYSEEEIYRANDISLTEVASALGYTLVKVGGRYSIREMDSIRIYNDRTWNRFSEITTNGRRGGNVIDFLMAFGGMTFPEAVKWSLERQGNFISEDQQKKRTAGSRTVKRQSFVLPEANENNKRVFAYLIKMRKLSYATVEYFVQQGLMYESREHHNLVWLGKDKDNKVQYAGMRGTYDPPDSDPFKCDVAGNDKSYGANLYVEGSKQVAVCEGFIDMLSYYELEHDNSSLVSLGMVGEAPLDTFLKEHPEIERIVLALDHDRPGREATERLIYKYRKQGYEIESYDFPEQVKDINKHLIAKRKRTHIRK